MRVGAALLILFATGAAAVAQTNGTTPTTPASPSQPSPATPPAGTPPAAGSQAPQTGPPPAPYLDSEFPDWLRQVRRAEVVTVGAFPITLILSSIVYQVYIYASNDFNPAFSPGIFGNSGTPLSTDQQVTILLGGVALAATVALADYIIGRIRAAPTREVAP